VSRSGVLIAGDVPSGVHSETFVAMSAIIIGAAETASTELKTSLNYLNLEMKDSKLILIGAGTKALLVTKVSNNANFEKVLSSIKATVNKIEESL
jgi:predicted regulator of Ras-like GTPase activity (Roadblock/LC7/MglB family)